MSLLDFLLFASLCDAIHEEKNSKHVDYQYLEELDREFEKNDNAWDDECDEFSEYDNNLDEF